MNLTSRCWNIGCLRNIVGIGVLVIMIGSSNKLHAGWLEPVIHARKQAAQEDVQEMIREANALAHEGKYAEALRALFDGLYTEQRTRLMLVKYSEEALERKIDDVFPITTAQEITRIEHQIIQTEQSPLLHWFRDPTIQIQEKFTMLEALRDLASSPIHKEEPVVFLGKYQGTFVQLMTSSLLDPSEKTDLLRELRYLIQTAYTATSQHGAIVEEIANLRREADKKFQAQEYLEAFILIDDAEQQADTVRLYLVSRQEDDRLGKQRASMYEAFVDADEGSLMQMFKNQEIPVRKRQLLLYDLRQTMNSPREGTDRLVLHGETYTGTFVDILLHPQIDWLTKDMILVSIDGDILKQEPAYLPDYLWWDDEEFLELWEQHRKETSAP